MKKMRHKIVLALFTLSPVLDILAREITGKENEDTEYYVRAFGYGAWNC